MPSWTRKLAGIVLAFVLWQAVAASGWVPNEYFPPPTTVAVAGFGLVIEPHFATQLAFTVFRMIGGLALAIVMGLGLALAGARWPVVNKALAPLVDILRFLPPPAIVPISIFAFGIGAKLFLFIISFAALWPIYINAANALRAGEPVLMTAGRSLGYSSWDILLRLRLPAALPEIVTGIRLGAGSALLATIAAEMLAGQTGLGFMLYDAAFTLHPADMFATMVVIGVLGVAFNFAIRQASRLFVGWHMEMVAMGEPS